jgi:hypothetical protein
VKLETAAFLDGGGQRAPEHHEDLPAREKAIADEGVLGAHAGWAEGSVRLVHGTVDLEVRTAIKHAPVAHQAGGAIDAAFAQQRMVRKISEGKIFSVTSDRVDCY